MTSVTLLSALLLLAGPAGPPKTTVELTDPTGDTLGPHGKDLTKAVLTGDGTTLRMTFTFAGDVAATLAASTMASFAVELLFDTDNNPKTGGKTFQSEGEGFEATGALRACIQYANGAACAGGMGAKGITGYFASIDLATLKPGGPGEDKTIRNSVDETGKAPCQLKASTITLALPYADLGLRPGQVVRIAVKEYDGDFKDAWLPDVALQLK